ncbi:DUF6174 domain-containing protein [Streptomyces galbus]|jgi:hypothetical protein|uniref:Lipoprotein n=1 Tax=Streptomyces galbus TaxID=33898 RepID=A0ABX1IM23_STRGB|nr:DUF6174 domain-containing protein [Streptomyces galbus]NKQ26683.1 hypothetical protein [Streptomyces galbus]
MTAGRSRTHTRTRIRARRTSAAGLLLVLAAATAACESTRATTTTANAKAPRTRTSWREAASYSYTLRAESQVLAGEFRVRVEHGRVTEVTGLDEDSRRQAREVFPQVPTIAHLLDRLDRAVAEHAATAEARYAPDGRPLHISLDWDANAVDDEAEYGIDAYRPASG